MYAETALWQVLRNMWAERDETDVDRNFNLADTDTDVYIIFTDGLVYT